MSAETIKPRGRGRPRTENGRRIVFPTRINEKEAGLIERAAQKAGLERTEWMRTILIGAAQAV